MKAALVASPGQLEIASVSLPPPGPGECLIRMRLGAVNPLDTYVEAGLVGSGAPYPRVLGVEGVGEYQGSDVVVFGHGIGTVRHGTWAEYCVAPADALVEVPPGIAPETAATCGVTGATAIRVGLDLADAKPGERVLVLGSSGAVGLAICSLLSGTGIHVTGQTTNPDKAVAVERAGADPLVASDPASFVSQVGRIGPFSVVIDALGADWTSAALGRLSPFGRLVSYGTSAGPEARIDLRSIYRNNITWRGYGGMAEDPARIKDAIKRALVEIAAGRMWIPSGPTMALEDASQAIRATRAHTEVGRIMLRLWG